MISDYSYIGVLDVSGANNAVFPYGGRLLSQYERKNVYDCQGKRLDVSVGVICKRKDVRTIYALITRIINVEHEHARITAAVRASKRCNFYTLLDIWIDVLIS